MKMPNVAPMVCLLTMLPLIAQSSVAESLYVGGGLGISRMNPGTDGSGYSVANKYDTGGKLYLGYDMGKRLSLEGYYSDLGSVTMSPSGSIGYKDMGVNATYYLFSTNDARHGLSLFVRGGIGKMENKTSLLYSREHNAHFMYGAGLEYGLGSGWSARADLDLYDRDAQLFTVSIMKRFGGRAEQPVQQPSYPEPVQAPPEPTAIPAEPLPTPVAAIDMDSDGDGVLDSADNCPGTEQGIKVDGSGCELKERIVLEGVTFANNSAELVGDSSAILDKVSTTLLRYPELYIEVGGYTDSVGSSMINQKLSERRAIAVRGYLVNKGVAADHITAKGYGKEDPIADNNTAEGRARNRRVEMKIVSGE